jgi:hypothetical protein
MKLHGLSPQANYTGQATAAYHKKLIRKQNILAKQNYTIKRIISYYCGSGLLMR